jgi:heavy-metal resistance protein CzcE
MKPIHAAVAALALGSTALAANAATNPKFIAELTSPASVTRTIVIGPDTRWVNVTQGERVKFVVSGQEFAIAFDGAAEPVNLMRVAPAGMLDHRVNAYVTDNPLNLPND